MTGPPPQSWHANRFKRPPADRQPKPVDQVTSAQGRPSIQVWFACSGMYQNVFRHVDGSGYLARCPKCGKSKQFRVGGGGTGRRAFEISC